MKNEMKTMSIMLTALFMSSLGAVYADAPNGPCASPCCPSVKQKPECCPCTPACCDPAPECCTKPCVSSYAYCRSFEGWSSFFIDAEALYWRASAEGLSYFDTTTTINEALSVTGVSATTVSQTDVNPDFKWKWGWRVGAGWESTCSGWNLAAYWTHLSNHSHHQQAWRLKYDTIDLVLGRDFWTSPCFVFKPFVGLRGARIRENLNALLTTDVIVGTRTSEILVDISETEKFRGLGPELGFKANWYWGRGFSIVGMFDVVLLYGNIKDNEQSITTFGSAINTVSAHTRTDSVIPGIDALLGLRWETFFWCNSMSFALQVSGEHHALFDLNRIGSRGTLNLDGVTASVEFGF